MRKIFIFIAFITIHIAVQAQEMDKMWGNSEQTKLREQDSEQMQLFEDGNYAMFVHWGLFSQLGNQWKGKTYYGVGEWLMHKRMANIPVEEYKKIVKDFNPKDFNAYDIVKLAKDAGMKYLIVTSKHHDGFAMFDSKVCDFNIVQQTPFARDPMKELADACHKLGLGFGFYYSHNQDWAYPGGNGGPRTDSLGNAKTFKDYFYEKCLPQVRELTQNYGKIAFIWFDTPGNIPKEYAQELINEVRKNQLQALISGRVGYDLGDYQTLGDMEIPKENIDGLWESIDVTNDAWGYAWYDQNWKTPKQLICNLVSTIARGGTYLLNVGPNPSGCVPVPAQKALLSVGKWISKYPQAIYGAGASPWGHALPWGDVTTNEGKVYLFVYTWPLNGKLCIPGVLDEVSKIELLNDVQYRELDFHKDGNWLIVNTPIQAPDAFVSVLRITPAQEKGFHVDTVQAVDPEIGITMPAEFAVVEAGKAHTKRWMEKFGEWKTAFVVDKWTDDTKVTWTVDIKEPGTYSMALTYAGDSRLVWSIENERGEKIQNQQNASHIYNTYPIGWMDFKQAGKHTLTIRLLEGDFENVSLMNIKLTPVVF